MSTVIVTDSASDLGENARSLGIDVVPMPIRFGSDTFLDGVDLTRSSFYSKLASAKELPVTSAASAEQFATAFAKHVTAGNAVFCPVVSSGLSEAKKNADAAAAQFPPGRVHVYDSKSFSGGLMMIATYAAERAKAGASCTEIAQTLGELQKRHSGFFTLPDVTYLGRSGRINKAQVMLGTMMKISPILKLTPDGKIDGEAQSRSFEKAQDLLVEIAIRHIPQPAKTRIAIGHTHAPEQGQRLWDLLRAKLIAPPKAFSLFEAGPTVAVNAGPGAVAIFTLEE